MKRCTSIGLLFLIACGGSGSNSRQPSTIAIQRQATVAECPNGGVVIDYGIDDDGDGLLDPNEVNGSEVVCHGVDGNDGASALIESAPEAPGSNCPAGGTVLTTGVDDDGDGVLDPGEVINTVYSCHGTDGSTVAEGLSSLVDLVPEPAGANCPNGGTAMHSGIDLNRDGILGPEEIDTTEYICNGTDGATVAHGLSSLIDLVPEPAGVNCPSGGTAMHTGIDLDRDDFLNTDEVTSTVYLCNGTEGATAADGLSTLIVLVPEPAGAHCPNGGTAVRSGVDLNGDGILDAHEVTSTAYICDGTDGTTVIEDASSLVELASESSGANCPNGGIAVTAGLDVNDNGVLDPGEVTSTEYLCNGGLFNGVYDGNYIINNPVDLAIIQGATEITGDLIITGAGVTSVVSLPNLTRVGGSLRVNNVADLQTLLLANLNQIGGNLILDAVSLTSLDMLNLRTVGNDLTVEDTLLTSLAGIAGLTSVGRKLKIFRNGRLVDMVGLSGLTTIDQLWIQGATSLVGLENLGSVNQLTLIGVMSLVGLNGLTQANVLTISSNRDLTSLSGLENLTSTTDVTIEHNDALVSLGALSGITEISGELHIENNQSLTNIGINGLTRIGGPFWLADNPSLLNLAGLEQVATIQGDVTIHDNDGLTRLTGLDGLTSLGGNLLIEYNSALRHLDMPNLVTISEDLIVFANHSLGWLDMPRLANVGGDLDISDNSGLPTCWAQNFATRVQVGGAVMLFGNFPTCP